MDRSNPGSLPVSATVGVTALGVVMNATTASSENAKTGSISGTRARRMNFSEAVTIATDSLWAHKLRSILTLLGVVIGVAAVIAVVSLINGANQYVATRVFRLGADVFGVLKQSKHNET